MTDKDWTLVPLEPTVVQVNAGVDSDDMRTGFETVKHIYRTMVRAAPFSPSSGWFPIETVPRDGTRFLFWNGLVVGIGRYLGQSGSTFGADSFAGETGLDPTHWMPLPEAPV